MSNEMFKVIEKPKKYYSIQYTGKNLDKVIDFVKEFFYRPEYIQFQELEYNRYRIEQIKRIMNPSDIIMISPSGVKIDCISADKLMEDYRVISDDSSVLTENKKDCVWSWEYNPHTVPPKWVIDYCLLKDIDVINTKLLFLKNSKDEISTK